MPAILPAAPSASPRPRVLHSFALSFAMMTAFALFTFPRVAAAEPGDEFWSTAMGQPGVAGQVEAATAWSGSIIVAGDLQFAGSTPVHNVARWDGTRFHAMGSGFNGRVTSLAVVSGVLYAAGDFDSSGTTAIPHVARWTGSAWAKVGTGGPDNTSDLRLYADGTSLLLLGEFTEVGSPPVPAQAIARWNGSAWSSLGGFSGASRLNAAARVGTRLYVGGWDVGSGSLHWYEGATWTSSDRITSDINTLAALGSLLYIHGDFFDVDYGNVPADHIASFDGTDFAALGGVSFDGVVETIGVDNGQLIVLGDFSNPHWRCAYWDGFSWTSGPLGLASTGGYLNAFARSGSNLLLGGVFINYFNFATSMVEGASNVVVFDGVQLRAAQSGSGVVLAYNDFAYDVGVYGNKLIASGPFRQIGNLYNARGMAAWDGSRWTELGTGLEEPFGNPSGQKLTTWNSKLVVSGYFTGAGGVTSANIAAWDGTSWQGFDGGFAGQGAEVVDYAGTLIASAGSGNLGTAVGTGTTLGQVARWTGSQWQTIGTTTQLNSLAQWGSVVWNGKFVYAASFNSMNGVPANNVAQWNGTTWTALGAGLNGMVFSLGVYNGELYASGLFTHSGATPIPGRIAKWNGSAWEPVGAGLDAVATVMSQNAGKLYVTGGFSTAGGAPAHRLAAWDGTTWSALGSGLGGGAYGNGQPGLGMTTWGDSLFVAGFFNTAGAKSSNGIARWFKPAATDVPVVSTRIGLQLRASPNPITDQVQLALELAQGGEVQIQVFDLAGRLMREVQRGTLQAGSHRWMWDGRDRQGVRVAPGVYRARVRIGTETGSTRLVLLQ